jgi:hypothetical protein
MDYILGYALTFKSFFIMISFQYVLQGLNIWYMMEKKYGLKKIITCNLHEIIV